MLSKILQATWIVSNDSNTDASLLANVEQIQQRLQTELGFSLQIFDDVTDCTIELGYFSPITDKRILILDAAVVNEALHSLHNLCHVVRIFVYWINLEESLMNSLKIFQNKYKKVSI